MWIRKGVCREMNKSRLAVLLVALLAAALAVTACGKKTPPKEALQKAWAASMEMKSFTFDGSLAIDELELPPSAQNEAVLPYLGMIENTSLSIRGAYTRDPLKLEAILKLTIPGDLAVSFEVPLIWANDKVYAKIPAIPMLPLGDAAGKFVEIDPAGLAEGEGAALPAFNVEVQRKLAGEALGIVFSHLDEEHFFREVKKEDVPGLPGDLKADRFIKFSIAQDNFDAFMQAFAENIMPEIIDLLLASEDYRSELQLTEEELKRAKEELAAKDPESLRNELEALKQNLTVHEISVTSAIKGDKLVYQKLKASFEAAEDGETTKIGFSFDIRYDNINKDVKFEHEIPEDALTMEELLQSLFSAFAS